MTEKRDLTPERFKLAADIIDAKRFSASAGDSEDMIWAAAFIFDEGIFYLGENGMAEVKQMLLATYQEARARATCDFSSMSHEVAKSRTGGEVKR